MKIFSLVVSGHGVSSARLRVLTAAMLTQAGSVRNHAMDYFCTSTTQHDNICFTRSYVSSSQVLLFSFNTLCEMLSHLVLGGNLKNSIPPSLLKTFEK
jgi:hypothetical protein